MNANAPLTSAEIGALWTSYIELTFSICTHRYFLHICECEQTKQLIQKDYAYKITSLAEVEAILRQEDLPIPNGFNESDVFEDAPRLFSDNFLLEFFFYTAKLGSANTVSFLSIITRSDIRQFYSDGTTHYLSMFNLASELLLEKGIYVRPPNVETQKEVEYITSHDYLGSLMPFVNKRPLNTIEISHLFMHAQTNTIGLMLCTAFSQVALNDKVKKHMLKGKELTKKIITEMNKIMTESEVQTPTTWDAMVTDSTTSPFSDRLLLKMITTLSAFGIGIMGNSFAASMRADVQGVYLTLLKDIAQYAKDSAQLMIDYNWLEKPPTVPNRNQLAEQ
jgi:hypothetical protein